MDVQRWAAEPVEQLTDAIGRQMIHTESMTIARIALAEGARVPTAFPCQRAGGERPRGPGALPRRRRGTGSGCRRVGADPSRRPARGPRPRGLGRAGRLLAGAGRLGARRRRAVSAADGPRESPSLRAVQAPVASSPRSCDRRVRSKRRHQPSVVSSFSRSRPGVPMIWIPSRSVRNDHAQLAMVVHLRARDARAR